MVNKKKRGESRRDQNLILDLGRDVYELIPRASQLARLWGKKN